MNSFAALMDKTPVVSTFGSLALRESAPQVQKEYDWHATTYVEQSVLKELRHQFISKLCDSQTPKSCLVAPFGYGKTATAIGFWKAADSENILAIPPISCSSLTELAHAMCYWLLHVLPEHTETIMEAHDSFLASSAKSLARRDELVFGIPLEQALASIKDKLERGYLDFEDVSINLISFIEQVTAICQEAGYNGLAVIIDEFQQLLGNASKGVLVALRQLIWGLRTRKLAFGLMITMDPDTERTLADRAGDILHRIKDDGMYLNIRHVYDRNFPHLLWCQYATALDLSESAKNVVDDSTLDALGQLCEREDLSNGPRTVISAFQRIAILANQRKSAVYSPIQLIDDLTNSEIRFDGDRSLVPSLVSELLSYPYFKGNPKRSRVLKLIAAFPRGCSHQVAKSYGLEDAWIEVGDDLRGEILTELDEGLALIELQRVGRPVNQLNVILRQYWMQITDQQIIAENAPRIFAEVVLPLLFPERENDLNGWYPIEEIQLTSEGYYFGIYEGSSSSAYPLRRVAVTIAPDGNQEQRKIADVDFQIIFRLCLDSNAQSSVLLSNDKGRIEFNLAIAQISKEGLSGGIAWIEHYISPHPISPAVVLSLLQYLKSHRANEGTSERDQARIEDAIARLQEWLLSKLLPVQLLASSDLPVMQSGYGAFKELMYALCRNRWPNYKTLIIHQHWSKFLDDYGNALDLLTSDKRVGTTPAGGTKSEIAELFGIKRHAGFKSRSRQYGNLLEVEEWRGETAMVRFFPHPAEIDVLRQVRKSDTITEKSAYLYLRTKGFSPVEAEFILDFACKRAMLIRRSGSLYVPEAPTRSELRSLAQSLSRNAKSIAAPSRARLQDELRQLQNRINEDFDPIQVKWQLDKLESQIDESLQRQLEEERLQLEVARTRLLKVLVALSWPLPSIGKHRITNHLNAVKHRLYDEQIKLRTASDSVLRNTDSYTSVEVSEIAQKIFVWTEHYKLLERWEEAIGGLESISSAAERLQMENGELQSLYVLANERIREARAILAQVGIKALDEVSQLEVSLAELQEEFAASGKIRAKAYERIAFDLYAKMSSVLELPVSASPPQYDENNDEASFCHLTQDAVTLVGRAIQLLDFGIEEPEDSSNAHASYIRLRQQIRSISVQAGDPRWLISSDHTSLSETAQEAINELHEQLHRFQSQTANTSLSIKRRLASLLMSIPDNQVNLSELLDGLSEIADAQEVIRELLWLQNEGIVRLTLEFSKTTEE